MSDSVPLREHLEAVANARWSGHVEAHQALALAIETQDKALDARLDGMNEWRSSMNDLTGRFATDERADALVARIDALEDSSIRRQATEEERRAATERRQWLIGALVTVAAVGINLMLRLLGV